jgi:hypothetical protein
MFPAYWLFSPATGPVPGQVFLLPRTQLDFYFGAHVSVFVRGLQFMLRARWPCFGPMAAWASGLLACSVLIFLWLLGSCTRGV